jgi:hypothetical protein
MTSRDQLKRMGGGWVCFTLSRSAWYCLIGLKLILSRFFCIFNAKTTQSKIQKLKAPNNSKISLNFNCIFSNHQVMLQLLGLERPYVLCTCLCLTKVSNFDFINSASTFTNARSFGPLH